jgi:hypothetical protein
LRGTFSFLKILRAVWLFANVALAITLAVFWVRSDSALDEWSSVDNTNTLHAIV